MQPLSPVIPLILLGLVLTGAAGGLAAARAARASRYAPRVLLVGSAAASALVLLAAMDLGGLVLAGVTLVLISYNAVATFYVRNHWTPQENGVGDAGERYRARWGFTELVREVRRPMWHADHVSSLTEKLLTDNGRACILGPRLDAHNRETEEVVTVRLGAPNSGIVGLIAGKPEMGKTTSAIRVLSASAEAHPDGSLIIIDPKGDATLRAAAIGLAARHGVRFWEWSEDNPLDPLSSTMTTPHLAVPAAIERLMATDEWTEPYYENLTRGAWTDAAELLQLAGRPLTLQGLIQALRPDGQMKLLADVATRARAGEIDTAIADELKQAHDNTTTHRWRELEGASERLRGLARSGLGARLAPQAEGGRTIASLAAEPGISYLRLDSGLWPETSKKLAELLVIGLMQDAGTVAESGRLVTIFADEIGAIPAKRLDALVQRGRSSGFSFIGALQTLAALGANDPVLAAQFTGTLSWAIGHTVSGQSEAGEDDAERLSRLGGTRIERELTTQTSGGFLAIPTGSGSARQVDSYILGPNGYRSLPKGAAGVIDLSLPTEHPDRVRRTGITPYTPTVRVTPVMPQGAPGPASTAVARPVLLLPSATLDEA